MRERLALLEDPAGHLTGFLELIVEVLSPGEQNVRHQWSNRHSLIGYPDIMQKITNAFLLRFGTTVKGNSRLF